MAQRTEKEETEFKVPETLTLCVNNCGVTATPATNKLCQKCFNATSASSLSLLAAHNFSFADKAPRSGTFSHSPRRSTTVKAHPPSSELESTLAASMREINRCSGCRRKVGLTGFRCRCGDMFCPEHRYSDRHVCSYDYKTAGREKIARENPVVKAAKIVKV